MLHQCPTFRLETLMRRLWWWDTEQEPWSSRTIQCKSRSLDCIGALRASASPAGLHLHAWTKGTQVLSRHISSATHGELREKAKRMARTLRSVDQTLRTHRAFNHNSRDANRRWQKYTSARQIVHVDMKLIVPSKPVLRVVLKTETFSRQIEDCLTQLHRNISAWNTLITLLSTLRIYWSAMLLVSDSLLFLDTGIYSFGEVTSELTGLRLNGNLPEHIHCASYKVVDIRKRVK